jgi:hypothetical protein
VADVHPDHAQLQADRIYLGWQYILLHADPGPPPKRPSPAENPPPAGPDPAEIELMRRERLQEDLLNRPVRMFRLFMLVLSVLILAVAVAGYLAWPFALVALAAAGGVAGICSYALLQGDRAVKYRVLEQQARDQRHQSCSAPRRIMPSATANGRSPRSVTTSSSRGTRWPYRMRSTASTSPAARCPAGRRWSP